MATGVATGVAAELSVLDLFSLLPESLRIQRNF